MKYATGKRVKVAEFDEGEHVSVEIPKAIWHPTDHVSFLKKSPGRSPTYKLICENEKMVYCGQLNAFAK